MSKPTMLSLYWQKRNIILSSPRENQVNYLRRNGFEQLVDRADIWFNPHFPDWEAHDIYTRVAAVEELAWRKAQAKFGRGTPPAVHHHEGAPL